MIDTDAPTRPVALSPCAQLAVDLFRKLRSAEAVLAGLRRSQQELEARLRANNRVDALKQVTGHSSIEQAIANTRRLIETLRDAAFEARRRLSPSEADFVDRCVLLA